MTNIFIVAGHCLPDISTKRARPRRVREVRFRQGERGRPQTAPDQLIGRLVVALTAGGTDRALATLTGMSAAARPKSLKALRAAEAECTRCPLYKNATQVVPGEGPSRARLMLVGEQPGDREDLTGKPFVGPAGRVLDKAIVEAGIDRREVFVTNAVKHFKFEPRGKRRLHKRPNSYEIDRCKWWIDLERELLKPGVVVALGATAVRSLMGKTMTIGKIRGQVLAMPDGGKLVATIHPSYLLRIRDDGDKAAQYKSFVRDLKVGANAAEAKRK